MAKAQQNSDVVEESAETRADDMVTITVPRSYLRHLPVEPSEFARVRDELKLSNKNVAEAIDRTLSRVSELTNSKGASRLIFEDFEQKLIAYAAAMPKAEATEAEAPQA